MSLPGVPAADEAGRDVLTEVLRKGARRVLAEAVDIEVQAWLDARAGLTDVYGRRLVVRNGQLPQRYPSGEPHLSNRGVKSDDASVVASRR